MNAPVRRSASLLFAALSAAVLLAQDQIGRPSFKTAIGLVQIDVSVLDGKRQPIRGLQASDFTVLEDGMPRPIRVFDAIELPPRRPPFAAESTTDSAPAVATNQAGDQDGRIVFILMDRTIPTGQPVMAAKRVAAAAIDAMGPTDLAAVVTTGGNVPQTLTSDRARLLRAVDQGDWSAIPSPEQQSIVGKYDPFSDGRCLCGLCVLETVTNLAEASRDAPRRNKMLLFIGSSIIVQAGFRAPSADVGCDHRVTDAQRKMFDALARSHLTVHSIDPSGLASNMCQGSCNGKAGQDGQAMRLRLFQENTTQRLSEQGSLDVLPELTGGRRVVSTNAPEEMVPEIFHESDTYYVLAFEPADAGSKKDRRSIEVKIARSGAHVSTVRYVPPGSNQGQTRVRPPFVDRGTQIVPAPGPSLDLALAGMLPDARVPLAMSLAAFASANGPKAYVAVSLDGAGFNGGGAAPPLDVALVVLDRRGRRVSAAKGTGAATLPGDLQTHVVLPPGDYEMRVAAQARGTDVAASVFSQFVIPPFADAPLSMSDFVLGTRESAGPPTDAAAPAVPIVASTARTFGGADTAWAFVEVYQGTQKTDTLQAVRVRTTIVDAAGRTVHGESSTLDAAAFAGRRAGVRVRLPLDVLAPGTYVLRVEAARASHSARRAVTFTRY